METLIDKLNRLKKERNAVILAHFYQAPEIQDAADVLGDSLALAEAAKKTSADVILFCGVHFMAETANILNPDKITLLPDLEAGCSLADAAPKEDFLAWKREHPDAVFVSYINCSAEVKAASDIICTSSNAERVIASIPPDKKICFAPDKYLGRFLAKKTGRDMILWNGSCQVHELFSETELVRIIGENPDALVLAHPECPENILDYADYVGSTTGIIRFAKECDFEKFIILTETGVIHQMKRAAPEKQFIVVPNLDGCSCNDCPHMKRNTLEKMVAALENLSPRIELPEELRKKALLPLERMLAIG